MKVISVKIDEIYVPVKLAQSVDETRVESVAEAYMEDGKLTPVLVRHDGKRYVLVKGVNRLSALKALGETEIPAYRVQAMKH